MLSDKQNYLCLCFLSHSTITLGQMASIFQRRTSYHCPQWFQNLDQNGSNEMVTLCSYKREMIILQAQTTSLSLLKFNFSELGGC